MALKLLTMKEAVAYLEVHGRTVSPETLARQARRGRLKAVFSAKYRVWETTEVWLDEYHKNAKPGAPFGNQNWRGNSDD